MGEISSEVFNFDISAYMEDGGIMSCEIKRALKMYYDLEASERNDRSPAEWKNLPKEEFLFTCPFQTVGRLL